MPEYRLSPKAREDTEAGWLYSMAQWGSTQTERYIDDVTAVFNLLADSPQAGATCEYIRAGYRKYPVLRHIVYYHETTYGIEVMRLLHDRMLASRYF